MFVKYEFKSYHGNKFIMIFECKKNQIFLADSLLARKMDPNYWAAGLKYPPQHAPPRSTTQQPSSNPPSTPLSSIDVFQLIERQRLASGTCASNGDNLILDVKYWYVFIF